MIGYFITDNIIADSKGNVFRVNQLSALNVLLDARFRKEINMFYNLDDCVCALLKIIGITKEQAIKLRDNEEITIYAYTLTYYPNKLFTIDYGEGFGHPFVVIYDAAQYIPEEEQKHQANYSIDECKELALKAETTGQKVQSIFKELELDYNKISSPVAAFKSKYQQLNIPTYKDVPIEVSEMFAGAVKGSWFETFKFGHYNMAFDYDINTAYASELYNLPDLRCGHWVEDDIEPEEAMLGCAVGEFSTDSHFHPFIKKNSNKNEYTTTPTGTWDDCMALSELQLMKEYRLGEFRIENGAWWIPDGAITYPFREIIQNLFKSRVNSNDWLVRKSLQRIMAGIWGKLLEVRKGEPQEFFNLVYGCMVETNTRLKVARTCLDNRIMPLAVIVDGILTDKALPLCYVGSDIGEWKLASVGKAIVLNPTMIALQNKSKSSQFGLDYKWLVDSIEDNPEAGEYSIVGYSVVSLADAIERDRIDLLGSIETVNRVIKVEPNNKRLWDKRISTGRELLETRMDSFGLERSMLEFAKQEH